MNRMKQILASMAIVGLLAAAPINTSLHTLKAETIDGEWIELSAYRGKVLLIVNTASRCGLTPQYKELQTLYEAKKDQGLVILGFPANNFAGQEPGTDAEIEEFCTANYGVSFPMFSKVSVKGEDASPVYRWLTSKSENGVMDSEVKWNFQKYLVDKEGRLVSFFEPRRHVNEPDVVAQIDALLGI